jgi:circadian clock protein KaiC
LNSTLITGSAGVSKTILASYFAASSCRSKERALYFSFEESPDQLIRNMASVGIKLKPFVQSGILQIHSSRPSLNGLEMHLLVINKIIKQFKPKMVIIDPITSLVTVGNNSEVRAMLVRLMDLLKTNQINAVFTALTHPSSGEYFDFTIDAVSSLADTWIQLSNDTSKGLGSRQLVIVKSRGMGHSNQMNEFTIGKNGIKFNY